METEPAKLCECGCGQPTQIARQTRNVCGHVKGQPIRFIHGHHARGKNNPKWRGGKIKVNCAWCGKEKEVIPYYVTRLNNFFCNNKCHGKWKSENTTGKNNHMWRALVKVNCAWCKQELYRIPSQVKCYENLFCDTACHGKWMSENVCGINSPQWKGGISFGAYCAIFSDEEFKESIRGRDDHKCQNPYCRGNIKLNQALTVHHIDYDKKECRPDNLITICRSCNASANKDREWHEAWYQAILFRQTKLIHSQKGLK